MDHTEVPFSSARRKSQVPVVGHTPDPNHVSHHQLEPQALGPETGIKAVVLVFWSSKDESVQINQGGTCHPLGSMKLPSLLHIH